MIAKSHRNAIAGGVDKFESFDRRQLNGAASGVSQKDPALLDAVELMLIQAGVVDYERFDGGLSIAQSGPNGFSCAILNSENRRTVVLGGWYDDFDCDRVVVDLLGRAIAGEVRLRETVRGNQVVMTTVELLMRGEWYEIGRMSTVRLFDGLFRRLPVAQVRLRVNSHRRGRAAIRHD